MKTKRALNGQILKRIRDYAMHMDHDVAFGGNSKGNRHLFRVNRLVKGLVDREGADRDIAVAGGWLHDVGLVKGNLGHCFKGAVIARKFLRGLGIDNASIARIVHCIEAHDGEIKAATVEAKLVHDADTLDKMGPLGFIRHAWKLSNVEYEDFTVERLLEFIPGHLRERLGHLYLGSSKRTGKRLEAQTRRFLGDSKRVRAVLAEVRTLSRKGVPTEKVIRAMSKNGLLGKRLLKVLDGQMRLSYFCRRRRGASSG